jgi:thiamine biosynthesis lipoprotein
MSRQFGALGTLNSIEVFDCTKSKLLDSAFNRVIEIDNRMSAFKHSSDISRLNDHAGREPTALHTETVKLLCMAKAFSVLSGGAFDITVRPLVEMWGIGKKINFIPDSNEIEKIKGLVDYRSVEIDKKNSKAFVKEQGQAVDLGGIAKGYAADEVKRILAQGGVTSALINLGGNIIALGSRPDKKPWRIGIQNPAAATGDYLGILSLTDKTVVTSGSNERFFVKDGVCYHHILDPHTGAPAQSGLLSVTVVSSGCSAQADALTTALFVLGAERGIKLLKRFNADAIFITDDFRVHVTGGLLKAFAMKKAEGSAGCDDGKY